MTASFSGKTVLVTGGTGFIGQYLVSALLREGANVIVLSRNPGPPGTMSCKIVTGDLRQPSTFKGICAGVDTVFHLGGHAHAIDEPDGEGATAGSQVTVEGTRFLLEESRQAGVRTFVFFSSVKAMGEGSESCLDETAENRPVTAYGKAKHGAEKLVLNTANSELKTTVLRLPMVYGRGCKGNLPRMIQAVARGRFPPLPETGNRRSMVDVRDVVQAALLAATNPVAAGKIYIVTDGHTYSTRQIYEWICKALQVSVPRWTIPLSVLRIAAHFGDIFDWIRGQRFIFDTSAFDKLTSSAWYSSEKISRELNYRPGYTLKGSLPDMVIELRRIE